MPLLLLLLLLLLSLLLLLLLLSLLLLLLLGFLLSVSPRVCVRVYRLGFRVYNVGCT